MDFGLNHQYILFYRKETILTTCRSLKGRTSFLTLHIFFPYTLFIYFDKRIFSSMRMNARLVKLKTVNNSHTCMANDNNMRT